MTHTALITGCSSGFGLASAKLFLARGWNVVATMRSPDPALFESHRRLLVTALDVTNSQSISEAVANALAHFGRIDVLVNNAGVGLFGAAEATPADVTQQVFETNTFGVMATARAVIPHMRERGSGTIVNVTSSVGIAPMPLVAVYTASKYAIEGYSESLAHELRTFGVRVKIVQPGLAPTTSFATKSGGRRDDLLPSAYAAFATRYLASMQNYPTAYTTETDVAEATFTAATSTDEELRYPAGADSEMLAKLRQSLTEQEFMARMRTMTGG
jgi:NAD(P)-dependent dehydrogenase (short-subunit alcohol dehydrogenase family)